MNKLMTVASIALAVALVGGNAQAEDRAWNWSPLGVGIAAPVQLPFMSSDVYGLRLGGLLGINNDVYGLDAGAVEITRGDFAGIQASAFSWTTGYVRGLQLGALVNCVHGNLAAFQVAAVNADYGLTSAGMSVGVVNYAMSYTGVEMGGLNWNNAQSCGLQLAVASANQEEFTGAMLGAFNFARTFTGFQCGAINMADEATGFQLGVFNAAERLQGVQIGLLNTIVQSSLPFMVVMNASF